MGILWDPSARLFVSGFQSEASKNRRTLRYLLQDCDSSYGLEYYVDGMLQRSVTYQDDKVWEEYGVGLPEEVGLAVPIWGSDESFCFGVMERVTGVSQTDLAAATYQIMQFLG